MKRITISFLLIAFMFSSCSENIEIEEERNVLPFETISFNQVCGWCLGRQSLSITEDQMVKYLQNFPCGEEDNVKADRMLTEKEIQELNETFDLENFLSIKFDQCGECYDGCDDTIILEGLEGENHTIRYDSFDKYEELQGIKPFVETLLKIRNSF